MLDLCDAVGDETLEHQRDAVVVTASEVEPTLEVRRRAVLIVERPANATLELCQRRATARAASAAAGYDEECFPPRPRLERDTPAALCAAVG
jgi:hypothetical protein